MSGADAAMRQVHSRRIPLQLLPGPLQLLLLLCQLLAQVRGVLGCLKDNSEAMTSCLDFLHVSRIP